MDLLLNKLNVAEFVRLKRETWPLLRTHKVKPLEILPFIRGLSENDIDEITSAAKIGHKTTLLTTSMKP